MIRERIHWNHGDYLDVRLPESLAATSVTALRNKARKHVVKVPKLSSQCKNQRHGGCAMKVCICGCHKAGR
jgi:hypothetical protein